MIQTGKTHTGKSTALDKLRRLLACLLALATVVTSGPISQAAVKKPTITGLPTRLVRYNQKTTQRVRRTAVLRNVSTNTYNISWRTNNSKVARTVGAQNKRTVLVDVYYRTGSAKITATMTHKRTKKKTTVSKIVTVYQGATGADIGDRGKRSITGKTVQVAMTDTYKVTRQTLPVGKVTYANDKIVTLNKLSAAEQRIGTLNKQDVFTPNQKNTIGRGNKVVTLTATAKGGSKRYSATTNLAVRGGRFLVDSEIDRYDASFQVGVDVKSDINMLKGTNIVLEGKPGTDVEGRTLHAKHVGTIETRAIYQIQENILTKDGAHNGTYTIKSFLDGAVYSGARKDLVFLEDLSQNTATVLENSTYINNQDYTFQMRVTTESAVNAQVLRDVKLELVSTFAKDSLLATFDKMISTDGVIQFKVTDKYGRNDGFRPGDYSFDGPYMIKVVNRNWSFVNLASRMLGFAEDPNVYIKSLGAINNETMRISATLDRNTPIGFASGSQIIMSAVAATGRGINADGTLISNGNISSDGAIASPSAFTVTAAAVVEGNKLSYRFTDESIEAMLILDFATFKIVDTIGAEYRDLITWMMFRHDLQLPENQGEFPYVRKLRQDTRLASLEIPDTTPQAISTGTDASVEFPYTASIIGINKDNIKIVPADADAIVELIEVKVVPPKLAYIEVKVTAEDRTVTETYYIEVTVADTPFEAFTKKAKRIQDAIQGAVYTATSREAPTTASAVKVAQAQIDAVGYEDTVATVEATQFKRARDGSTGGMPSENAGYPGELFFNVLISVDDGQFSSQSEASRLIMPIQQMKYEDQLSANRYVIDAAKAAVEAERFVTTSADAYSTDTAMEVLEAQIIGLRLGVQYHITAVEFVAAEDGTRNNVPGTHGALGFTVELSAGDGANRVTATSALLYMTVEAAKYIDPALPGHIQDVADAILLLRRSYTSISSEAATHMQAIDVLRSQLEILPLNGVRFTITNSTFAAATDGTESNKTGTRGELQFRVELAKGEDLSLATGITEILYMYITPKPYESPQLIQNRADLTEARRQIQETVFSKKTDEDGLETFDALADITTKIRQFIPTSSGITFTVNNVLNGRTEQQNGNEDTPLGTNGSILFTVTLRKGSTSDESFVSLTTDPVEYLMIPPTYADIYLPIHRSKVQAAKTLIQSQVFRTTWEYADSEENAILKLQELLDGMSLDGVTTSVIVAGSGFSESKDGTDSNKEGNEGKLQFRVALSIGKWDAVATDTTSMMSMTIQAKTYDEVMKELNMDSLKEILEVISSTGYAATWRIASGTGEALEHIRFLLKDVALDGAAMSVVEAGNGYTAPVPGTAEDFYGTPGAMEFKVILEKGNMNQTAVTESAILSMSITAPNHNEVLAMENEELVSAAKVLIETNSFDSYWELAGTTEQAIQEAYEQLDKLVLEGVTASVIESEVEFTAAVDGDETCTPGVAGMLKFKLNLFKGEDETLATAQSMELVLHIRAKTFAEVMLPKNKESVASAKDKIENKGFVTTWRLVTTTDQAIEQVYAHLSELDLEGVTAEVTATADGFTAPIYGTQEDHQGTPGAFTFMVKLSRDIGGELALATSETIDIPMTIIPATHTESLVDIAKRAVEGESYESSYLNAGTEQDAIQQVYEKLAALNFEGVTSTVIVTAGAYTAPIDGSSDNTDGTAGSLKFAVAFSSGEDDKLATDESVELTLNVVAKTFAEVMLPLNQQSVSNAKDYIQSHIFETKWNLAATSADAVQQVYANLDPEQLDGVTMSVIVTEDGFTASQYDTDTFQYATDGGLKFNIFLSKDTGGALVTAEAADLSMRIIAPTDTELTQMKNMRQVEDAITAVEANQDLFETTWKLADTKENAELQVMQQVSVLCPENVTAEVIAAEDGFTMAEDGTEALWEGIDGSLDFIVKLSLGENETLATAETIPMTMNIIAKNHTEVMIDENTKSIENVKEAIDTYEFRSNWEQAATEGAAVYEVYRQLEELGLDGVTAAVIVTEDGFRASEAGTETFPTGTNGALAFMVTLSKGENETLVSAEVIDLVMVIQAQTRNDIIRDQNQVQVNLEREALKTIIKTTWDVAGTEDEAIAEVLRQIKAAIPDDMSAQVIPEVGTFREAQDGDNNQPQGYVGYFGFAVVLSKGEGETLATAEPKQGRLDITARTQNQVWHAENTISVASAAAAVKAYEFETTWQQAGTREEAVSEVYRLLGDPALALEGSTPSVVVSDDGFEAATDGTIDFTMGTHGALRFTVMLSKGEGATMATAEVIELTMVIRAKTYDEIVREANQAYVDEASNALKTSYTTTWDLAETEAEAAEEVQKQIEASLAEYEVNVEVIPEAGTFIKAEDGNTVMPQGTKGYFGFSVVLSKGVDETLATTSAIASRLDITARTYNQVLREENAVSVASAAAAVKAYEFETTWQQAGTRDEAVSEVYRLLEDQALALEGSTPTVVVSDDGFEAATDGTIDFTTGTNGALRFTVMLSKGTGDTLATAEVIELTMVIRARSYDEVVREANQDDVNEASKTLKTSYTTTWDVAGTEEEAAEEAQKQIEALLAEYEVNVEVIPEADTFRKAEDGNIIEQQGVKGYFGFEVVLSKGVDGTLATSSAIASRLDITARTYNQALREENAVSVASAAAAVKVYEFETTWQQAGTRDEAVSEVYRLLGDPALALEGSTPTVVVSDDGFEAATDGTIDFTMGTNGALRFTVMLSKGTGDTIATAEVIELTMVVRARSYDDVVREANQAYVDEASKALKSSYTTTWDVAGTEEDAAEEAKKQIEASLAEYEVNVEVIPEAGTFRKAEDGNMNEPQGVKGYFGFAVVLSKGVDGTLATTSAIASRLDINARTYNQVLREENAASVASAAAAVKAYEFETTWQQAGTREEAVSEVYRLLGDPALALEGSLASVVVSEDGFGAATDGTIDFTTGTHGALRFTVILSKGTDDTVVTAEVIDLTMTILAKSYDDILREGNQVLVNQAWEALNTIRNEFKTTWEAAETEEDAAAEAQKQVDGMLTDGVKAEIILELSTFIKAVDGNVDSPEGVNGYFKFSVVLSKGEDETLATAAAIPIEMEITAKTYNQVLYEENTVSVVSAAAVVVDYDFETSMEQATTEVDAVNEINMLLSVLELEGALSTVNVVDNSFRAAEEGTADLPVGTAGALTFTVTLTKGDGEAMATVTTEAMELYIAAKAYDDPSEDNQLEINSIVDMLNHETYESEDIIETTDASIVAAQAIVDGFSLNGVTVTLEAIAFSPSSPGTAEWPEGMPGSLTFKITVEKGEGDARAVGVTEVLTLNIKPVAYVAPEPE